MSGAGGFARTGLLRPVVASLAIAVFCLAYQLWLSAGGARKLTPEEIAPGRRGHYEVVVSIAPEAFHMTRMQGIGRLIEVRGNSVLLMDVAPDDIVALARDYWVADVRPWAGI